MTEIKLYPDDFKAFCNTHYGQQVHLPWTWTSESDPTRVHRFGDLADALQRVTRDGGMFALPADRASGKTTLSRIAAIWAVLNGHREFVLIGCASAGDERGPMDVTDHAFRSKLVRCCHSDNDRSGWSIMLSFCIGDRDKRRFIRTHDARTGSGRGIQERHGQQTYRPDLVILDSPVSAAGLSSIAGFERACDGINRLIASQANTRKPAVLYLGEGAEAVAERFGMTLIQPQPGPQPA